MAHAHALRDNTGMIAGIAAMAAGIGAVTAMLVTPKTGQEVRGGLKRRTSAAKDAVTHKFEHVNDEGQAAVEDAKNSIKDKASDVKTAAKDTTVKVEDKKAALK